MVKRELNPVEHSVLGATAGAFTGLVTTPLDVLKTRMMLAGASGAETAIWVAGGLRPGRGAWERGAATGRGKRHGRACGRCAHSCALQTSPLAPLAHAGQYKGVVDCARQIIRDEGTAAMFRCVKQTFLGLCVGAQPLPLRFWTHACPMPHSASHSLPPPSPGAAAGSLV